MRYQKQKFEFFNVNLDGNQFEDCIFFRCKMIYTGEGIVSFNRCTFTECDWVVDGAAERTLQFLSALYRGLGPEGHQLVEGIFTQIRSGTIGQPNVLPSAV